MKKRINWGKYLLLLCGIGYPVVGWTQTSDVKAAPTKARTTAARSSGLIPTTFQASFAGGDSISLEESFPPTASLEEVLVPLQFRNEKFISIRDQQRLLEEQTSESLYRAQSDPAYFERQRKAFREEYQRRVKAGSH